MNDTRSYSQDSLGEKHRTYRCGAFLIIPLLYLDVMIVMDAATHYTYVLNYSHAQVIQLTAHKETSIGVRETKELDLDDNNSPDYNELPAIGNETS